MTSSGDRRVRIGVVGSGYWGTKLLATLVNVPGCEVRAVCDLDARALAEAGRIAPEARAYSDYQQMLADGQVEAVLIASPAVTHYPVALRCLMAGLDVMVEKPFALCETDARAMIRTAEERGRVLMVGHTFLHNPAFASLASLVRTRKLGRINLIRTSRTHFGLVRPDVDALWDLAPHDISMASCLAGTQPDRVTATGSCFTESRTLDAAQVTLGYPGGLVVQIFVSWMDPKRRRIVEVYGNLGKATFNDVTPSRKLRLVEFAAQRRWKRNSAGRLPWPVRPALARRLAFPPYRTGTPLEHECAHFLARIQDRRSPSTGAENALSVTRVLEAATRSIETGGQMILLRGGASSDLLTAAGNQAPGQ